LLLLGTNIRLLNRLYDILDCERKMGGRTVQKYVETPLLCNHHRLRPQEAACKFDLRVWVLVTSFAPLRAHIFSRVYGRRCGRAYNYAASSIADTYTHLTNYSIQSKRASFALSSSAAAGGQEQQRRHDSEEGELFSMQHQGEGEGQGGGAEPGSLFDSLMRQEEAGGAEGGGGAASKLRSAIHTQRARPASAGAARRPAQTRSHKTAPAPPSSSSSELLLTFDELLAELAGADPQRDGRALWSRRVWPSIRRKVAALLLVSAQRVQHRPRSFEFLGFDVLIDEQCEPWILEVG
jgi:hypothetical protein